MKRWRSVPMAAFVVLAMVGSGASAGELGPTSRGTVSISITIAPHVEIGPSRAAASSGDGFCLRPTGIRSFHLTVVPSGASSPATVPVPLSADGGALCAAAGAARRLLTGASAAAASAPSGAVTLLVTPD